MATYTGKPVTLSRPIDQIYERVADLSQYRSLVEQLPEEHRERLSGIEFDGDGIRMDAPAIGQLVFKISERVPTSRVSFVAEGCPVPLSLSVNLKEAGENSTTLTPAVKIEIPPMLRPFIGNKIQEAADKFGEVFTSIFK
ncbi:MAG: SRPBCC family protein [Duncaniella sp.]|nr:SRPBCC family protein [Duncaniella sp.]MDE6062697.1 SRPBCC family protein [Duncaniella sp.]MDE6431525.1 SRPBCC family protein [Duncaniella sp.]MDE6813609.1 SRPBCC family protein [Duncaniella sp.]